MSVPVTALRGTAPNVNLSLDVRLWGPQGMVRGPASETTWVGRGKYSEECNKPTEDDDCLKTTVKHTITFAQLDSIMGLWFRCASSLSATASLAVYDTIGPS